MSADGAEIFSWPDTLTLNINISVCFKVYQRIFGYNYLIMIYFHIYYKFYKNILEYQLFLKKFISSYFNRILFPSQKLGMKDSHDII